MILTNAKPTNPSDMFNRWDKVNSDVTKSYLSTPYLQSLKFAGNQAGPTNNVYVRANDVEAHFPTTDDVNEILTRHTTVKMAGPASNENSLSPDTLVAPPDPKYVISPEIQQQTEQFQASAVKQLVQQFYEAYLAPIGLGDVNNRIGLVTGQISDLGVMFPNGFEGIVNTIYDKDHNMPVMTEFDTTTVYRFAVNELGDNYPTTYRFTTLNFPPYISHGIGNEDFVDTITLAKESKFGSEVFQHPDYKAHMDEWSAAHANEPWTTIQYQQAYKKEGTDFAKALKAKLLKEVTDKSFNGKKLVQRRNQATYRTPAFKQVNDNINTVQTFFEKCFGISSTYINEWDLSLYMQEGILSYNKYEYSNGKSEVFPNYVTNLTYGLLDDAPVKENYNNQSRMFTLDSSRSAEVDDVTPYAGVNMAVSSRMGIDSYVTSVKCCNQPYDISRYPLSHYWTQRNDGLTNEDAGVSQFWLDNTDIDTTGEFVAYDSSKLRDNSKIKATASADHGLSPSLKTTSKKLHDVIKFDDTWKTMMSGWNSTDVNGAYYNLGMPYAPNAFSYLPYWKLFYRNCDDGFDDCDIYAIDADQQIVYSKIDYANNIFNIITQSNNKLQEFINSKLEQTLLSLKDDSSLEAQETKQRLNATIEVYKAGDAPISASDINPKLGDGDGSSDYVKVMGCKIPGSNLLKMWMKKSNGASKAMDGFKQGSNLNLGNMQTNASPAATVSNPKKVDDSNLPGGGTGGGISIPGFIDNAQPGNYSEYKVADPDEIQDLAGNMSYGKGVNQWSPFLYGGPHGEWMNPNTMEGYTQFQNELLSWVPTLPTSGEFVLRDVLWPGSKHMKRSNDKLYNNTTVLTLGELRAWLNQEDINFDIHKPKEIRDIERHYNSCSIVTEVRYNQEYYSWRIKPFKSYTDNFKPIRNVDLPGLGDSWWFSGELTRGSINGHSYRTKLNWRSLGFKSLKNDFSYDGVIWEDATLPGAAAAVPNYLRWYGQNYGDRRPALVEPGSVTKDNGKYVANVNANLMGLTKPLNEDSLTRNEIRNSYMASRVWHLNRSYIYHYTVHHEETIQTGSYGGGYGGYGASTYTTVCWDTYHHAWTTADYPYGVYRGYYQYGPDRAYNGSLKDGNSIYGVEEGKITRTQTRRFKCEAPSLPDMPFDSFKVVPVELKNLRCENKQGSDKRFFGGDFTAVEKDNIQTYDSNGRLHEDPVDVPVQTKGYFLEFDGWGTDGEVGNIDSTGKLKGRQIIYDPLEPTRTYGLERNNIAGWHSQSGIKHTDNGGWFSNSTYIDTLSPYGEKKYSPEGYAYTTSDWFPAYFANETGGFTPAYGWWSTVGFTAKRRLQRKQWWVVLPENLDFRCSEGGYTRGHYTNDELQTTLKTAWQNGYGQMPVTLPIVKNGKVVELVKTSAYVVRLREKKTEIRRLLTKIESYGTRVAYNSEWNLAQYHNHSNWINHPVAYGNSNYPDGSNPSYSSYKLGYQVSRYRPKNEDNTDWYWQYYIKNVYTAELDSKIHRWWYDYNNGHKTFVEHHSGYGTWGWYHGWRYWTTYYTVYNDSNRQPVEYHTWDRDPHSHGYYQERRAYGGNNHYDYGYCYEWVRRNIYVTCQYYQTQVIDVFGYTYYLVIDPSQVFWVLPDLEKAYGDSVKPRGLNISPDIVKAYTITPDSQNAKEVIKDIWPFSMNMLTKQSNLTPLPYSNGFGVTMNSSNKAGVATPYYLRLHGLWFSDIKGRYTANNRAYSRNTGNKEYIYNLVYRDGFKPEAQRGSDGRWYNANFEWSTPSANTWTGFPMTNTIGNKGNSPYDSGAGLGRTTTQFTVAVPTSYSDDENYDVFKFIDNLGKELCMPNPDNAALSLESKHLSGDIWNNLTDRNFLRYNLEDCFNSYITAIKTQLAWLDKFHDYAKQYITDSNIMALYDKSIDKNKVDSIKRYIENDRANREAFYTNKNGPAGYLNEDENICFEESIAWCKAIYDSNMSGIKSNTTLSDLIDKRIAVYACLLNAMQDCRVQFLSATDVKSRMKALGTAAQLTSLSAMVAADADTSRLINPATGYIDLSASALNSLSSQTWKWKVDNQTHVAYRSPAFATWGYLGMLYQIRRYWSNVRFAKDNGSYWIMRGLERVVPVLESQQKLIAPSQARKRVTPPSTISSLPTDVDFVQERTGVADKISNIVNSELPSKNEVGVLYIKVTYVSDNDITNDPRFATCDKDRLLNGYRPDGKEPGAVLLKSGEYWHGPSFSNMPIIYVEEAEKWAYVPEDDDYVMSSSYISARKKALSKKFAADTPLLATGLYVITEDDVADINAAVLDGNPIKTKTYSKDNWSKPQAGYYDENNVYHDAIKAENTPILFTLASSVGKMVGDIPEQMAIHFVSAKNEIYYSKMEELTYKIPGIKWRYSHVTTDRQDHYDEYQAQVTADTTKGRKIVDPLTGNLKAKTGQIISGITFNIDSGMLNADGIIGSAPLISQATPEELACSTRVAADYWRIVVPENVSCPPEYMTNNPTLVQTKGKFVGALAGDYFEDEPSELETLVGASSKAFSPIIECDTNLLSLQTQKAFGDISQAQLF